MKTALLITLLFCSIATFAQNKYLKFDNTTIGEDTVTAGMSLIEKPNSFHQFDEMLNEMKDGIKYFERFDEWEYWLYLSLSKGFYVSDDDLPGSAVKITKLMDKWLWDKYKENNQIDSD